MNILYRNLLFIFGFFIQMPLIAETVGISLLEHPEKEQKVVIINDWHIDALPECSLKMNEKIQQYLQKQSEQIERLFEVLKKRRTKTTAIVEMSELTWRTKQYQGIGLVLGNTLKDVRENGWEQGSVQFVTCDDRSNDEIVTSGICKHVDTCKELDAHCKKEGRETPYIFVGPIIKAYTAGIANRFSYLSEWIHNLHRLDGLPKDLKGKMLAFLEHDTQSAKSIIERVVSDYADISEDGTMLDFASKTTAKEHLALLYESSHGCDIPLLSQVLRCDNNTIVVHVGFYHGALLYERLCECGFVPVNSDVCMKVEQVDPYTYRLPTRVPRNIAEIIMQFFIDANLLSNISVEWDNTIDLGPDS